jgi:hypothetical protein
MSTSITQGVPIPVTFPGKRQHCFIYAFFFRIRSELLVDSVGQYSFACTFGGVFPYWFDGPSPTITACFNLIVKKKKPQRGSANFANDAYHILALRPGVNTDTEGKSS